ncbi:unnamed protein product [Eruca vesicaria subsp. sativa]|uniref:Uncharacterized protein n=1 Tax=Eruca vesicaria subsp. sativa TaxID=29727 RepID=A0ABC8KWR2_ERUVS|nr:unnamed protein product [Eruca vesicaria subsp. sativa]
MNRPQAEFRQLCLDIVEQLCGLPLALRVIGASLYGREIPSWEDKLCILKNSLDKSISVALKKIEVESILLNMGEETRLYVNPETFKRMRKLKFLKIHSNSTAAGGSKVCIVDDFDYLPPLRYLHWEAYTLKSLPTKFETNVLVELNLPDSSVETLWNGSQLIFF